MVRLVRIVVRMDDIAADQLVLITLALARNVTMLLDRVTDSV